MKTRKSLRKDKRGFTGLEAAIVLTAFVVVAAVFSYVVLNAGFFTTQKAKEVIHTGVESATSSLAVAGNVIGYGWQYNTTVTAGNITLGVGDNDTISSISFTDKNTLISETPTLYAKLSGATVTIPGYIDINVSYKDKAGTSNYTVFQFTADDQELSKTLTTSVYDVTGMAEDARDNVTGDFTVTAKAPQKGTYYVSGTNTKDSTNLTAVKLYLALTAGQNPIDMDTLVVSYMDRDVQVGGLTYVELIDNAIKGNMPMGCWNYTFTATKANNNNNLLETNEEAIIVATLPGYGV
ncbi:MAG: hypothetical protein H8D26_02395, partial [Methanomicrobia archaeon]|nr:hypothetical protein [Methanomicrobia archaeon]